MYTKDIREHLGISNGETLIMMVEGDEIIMERSSIAKKWMKRSESDLVMMMSEDSLKEDWDNEYDERWNKY